MHGGPRRAHSNERDDGGAQEGETAKGQTHRGFLFVGADGHSEPAA
jgi:hypothetical protein